MLYVYAFVWSRHFYDGRLGTNEVSDDLEEIVCIGSVEELEKHAGRSQNNSAGNFRFSVRKETKHNFINLVTLARSVRSQKTALL